MEVDSAVVFAQRLEDFGLSDFKAKFTAKGWLTFGISPSCAHKHHRELPMIPFSLRCCNQRSDEKHYKKLANFQ